MPEPWIVTENFLRGLQTTEPEDGHSFPGWREFLNMRNDTGRAKRRPGMVRIARAGTDAAALDLDGAADYVTIPYNSKIHDLKKHWTIEGLVEPDSVTGTQAILAPNHATAYPVYIYQNGTTLTAEIIDTGDTTVTLTGTSTLATDTAYSFQVKRDGLTVTLAMDGVVEDTDTVADLDGKVSAVDWLWGNDNGSNFFNGTVDYIRAFSVARPNALDGFMRFPSPRRRYVLFDYEGVDDANAIVRDKSKWGNHAESTSAPPSIATLATQHAPVQAMESYVTRDHVPTTYIQAGGKKYVVSMVQ